MKTRNRRTISCFFTKPMARLIGVALFLAVAGAMSTASAQSTWYVATDGADENGGTGWDDAFATIQKGIDASSNGDTVLVAESTYTGVGNKNIVIFGKDITVRSVNGPESCIIDLQNDGRGFYLQFTSEASVVEGFTIMNGYPASTTDYGVGVECWFCSTTIRNCIIKNNSGVQWGAGIRVGGSNPSPPVIVNCVFTGNQTTQGGSAVSVYQALATFINCTFFGNIGGLGAIAPSYTTDFTNCVFWGNTPTTIGEGFDISYSDVEGGYAGTGNINLPPDFVDPENGDFRLSSGSDCIDAGLNSVAGLPDKDLDGKPRLIDGDGDLTATADMGAFEYGDICECDYPLEDLDTDGSDLAAYINDAGGLELRLLASDYGRSDCPVYAASP